MKTLRGVHEIIIPILRDVILKYGLDDVRNPFDCDNGVIRTNELHFKNGGIMRFRGLDKGESRLGQSADIVYVNQAEQITLRNLSLAASRLRAGKQKSNGKIFNQMILDCNPAGPKHWILNLCKERKLDLITFWLTDNPYYYNHETKEWSEAGKNYHDFLKTFLFGAEYERGFLGKWVAAEGRVYHFDEKIHADTYSWDAIPDTWTIITARDFGATVSSPFVHVAFAVSPDRTSVMELPDSQIYKANLDINDAAQMIKEIEKNIFEHLGERELVRVSDTAGSDQLVLKNAGLEAIPGHKDVLDGIGVVRKFLREKKIIVLKPPYSLFHGTDDLLIGKCQEGFDEWNEYVHKTQEQQDRNPDTADHPQKGSDHYLDCVRYMLMLVDAGTFRMSEIQTFSIPQTDIFTISNHGMW